ncbi:MAG: hypothetical protein ABIB97_04580 [Patescibacteria group bacterium]
MKNYSFKITVVIMAAVVLLLGVIYYYFELNKTGQDEEKCEGYTVVEYENEVNMVEGDKICIKGTNTTLELADIYYHSEEIGEYAENPIIRINLLADGDQGAKIIDFENEDNYYDQARLILRRNDGNQIGLIIQKIWQNEDDYCCWQGYSNSLYDDPNEVICWTEADYTLRYCMDKYQRWADINCPNLTFENEPENPTWKPDEKGDCVGYKDWGGIYDLPLDQRIDLREFVKSLPNNIEVVAEYFDNKQLFMTLEEYNKNRESLVAKGSCQDSGYCSELSERELTEVSPNILATIIEGNVYRQQRDSIILYSKVDSDFVIYLKLYDKKLDNGEFATIYKFESYGGCSLGRNEVFHQFENILTGLNIAIPENLADSKTKESDEPPRYMQGNVLKPIPR